MEKPDAAATEPKPQGISESRADRDERQQAVEKDRTASRKAAERSRGKRKRGGGLGSAEPL